jgi:hypothetical protein
MGRRSDIKPLPSLARLNELLSYEPETGVLTWKTQPTTSRANIGFNNKCGGKVAGTIGAKGYLTVGIGKSYYLAHRIIWKIMTGADPVDQVDHEDTDRLNNRWLNLRPTENGPNVQNSKLRVDNSSGVKGVHWDAQHKKWRAVLTTNGVSVRLGRFASLEEAASVIESARMRDHGEFARVA